MIKNTVSIIEAKEQIKNLTQSKVNVTVNLGRNKTVSFSGLLSGVYNALFTVTPDDKAFTGKTTYSYQEFLCGKVKLEKQEKLLLL